MAIEYFCCYHSYRRRCEKLTDQELGRLFRALMEYSETGETQELAGRESIAFDFIAEDIDRSKQAYDERCRTNAENGRRGGRPKKADGFEENQEKPNGFFENQTEAKKAKGKGKGKAKGNGNENTLCASDDAQEPPDAPKGPSMTEVNELFERLWSLYPVKKGKGQVSDAKRRKLYQVGEEEMQRSIDRYLTELKKDADWRKPQNGSTFFDSGYVDYLDANFVPDEKREQPSVNRNGYQPPKNGGDRLLEMIRRGDFDER